MDSCKSTDSCSLGYNWDGLFDLKKIIIVFLCFKKQDMEYVYGKKFNICITKSNVQHMP